MLEATVAAGDQYALARAHYKRAALIDAVNQALRDAGTLTQIDQTLTVVDGQTEYALPADVGNLVSVLTTSGTSAPYTWTLSYNWMEVTGEADL